MNVCSKCRQEKSLTEFSKNKRRKDGLDGWCKPCARESNKKWRDRNVERVRKSHKEYNLNYSQKRRESIRKSYEKHREKILVNAINMRLKRVYGITLEEKKALREAQDNKCAICLREFKLISDCKIDHDHLTGKVRELLCNNCNSMLGHVREDIKVLTNAITYITRHSSLPIAKAERPTEAVL